MAGNDGRSAIERRRRLAGIALMMGAVTCFACLDASAKWVNRTTNPLQTASVHYLGSFLLVAVFLNPWANGQVERMNRTLKDATVRRYHYESRDQLRAHLQLFVDAHNHARRLKTLRGLTPYEHVWQVWTREPDRFRVDPTHTTSRDRTPNPRFPRWVSY